MQRIQETTQPQAPSTLATKLNSTRSTLLKVDKVGHVALAPTHWTGDKVDRAQAPSTLVTKSTVCTGLNMSLRNSHRPFTRNIVCPNNIIFLNTILLISMLWCWHQQMPNFKHPP